jgi:hypothetical protein
MWYAAFERLAAYKEKFGHVNVLSKYNDGGSPRLGFWAHRQRENYRKGSLREDRIDQLESIGFVWKLEGEGLSKQLRDDDTWENAFQRLVMYKYQHGDTNVPKCYNDGESPHLGIWVSQLRDKYMIFTKTCGNAGCISQERIDNLDSIGFVWELGRQDEYDAAWMAQFEDYKAFQQKYNTTKAKILA